jgi:predicted transcriptional regulator
MTAEQFEELDERGRFVAAVAQGLADEEAGHVMTTAEMKAALERKHGPIPWK